MLLQRGSVQLRDFRMAYWIMPEISKSEYQILLVHATGILKECWIPVANELRKLGVCCQITAVDMRGHGESGSATLSSWLELGQDIAEFVPQISRLTGNHKPMVAVGHSAGGAAITFAEAMQPGLFTLVIAYEPILFAKRDAVEDVNDKAPLEALARKRRNQFASREEAYQNFVSKLPFKNWVPEALHLYVQFGLREVLSDDSAGSHRSFQLTCKPDFEANFYRLAPTGQASLVKQLRIPFVLIQGDPSNGLYRTPANAEALVRLATFGKHVVMKGTGHFGPMERPQQLSSLLYQEIARVLRTSAKL